MSGRTTANDGSRTDSDRFGMTTIDELLTTEDEDTMPDLDFEEEWGDPLESEHTDLDSVPDSATIEFDGKTRSSAWAVVIKRAMIDPEATVHPDDGE